MKQPYRSCGFYCATQPISLTRCVLRLCGRRTWGKLIYRCVAWLLLGLTLSVIAAPDLDKMSLLAQQRYGASGAKTVQQWRTLIDQTRALPNSEKVKRVNEFINQKIAFKDDQELWGQPDYWATPLETLGRSAGDCEDFTIAKYATLKLLGVPIEHMRLIYVRAQIGGPHSSVSQAHMVLGYYPKPGEEPVILDNLVTEIYPASRRTDLTPVFSFNSEGLWVGQSASGNATARLSRWRGVLERLLQDGLE